MDFSVGTCKVGVKMFIGCLLCVLVAAVRGKTFAAHDVQVSGTVVESSGSALVHSSEVDPEFTSPIRNVTVAVGREAVLSCTVSNLGHYKVGWMKAEDQTILTLHTRVITQNPRISVSHDNLRTWQLRIRQLKETDRGCYMCQINTNSMKKQVGCVDVQVPPDIIDTETSGDVTVSEGENATLVCRATGHPEPRILWRREDGDHLVLRPRLHFSERVDTYSGPVLTLQRLERRQMGAYLCIASNDVPPAVSKRITLNINFAPTIKVPNQLLGAPLNTDVHLECLVEAFPNTINYWVKNSADILLNGSKYFIEQERSGYKARMKVTIRNITLSDIGTYKCIASNSIGRIDGTIRLYEIKIITTTTPSTTTAVTTVETTPNPETSPITHEDEIYSTPITTTPMPKIILELPVENWLFPSVAPEPLETMSSRASDNESWRMSLLFCVIFYVIR